MSVLGVILAAGASRRMGRPKALLPLGGGTLVAAHAAALGLACDDVLVVHGPDVPADRLPAGVIAIHNPDPTSPMVESLRLALRGRAVTVALVTPVDTPPARIDTLRRLVAHAPAVPTVSAGNTGHPVAIDAGIIASLLANAPDGGLRTLLSDATRVPVADPDAALDFDDPAAWAAWSSRVDRSAG